MRTKEQIENEIKGLQDELDSLNKREPLTITEEETNSLREFNNQVGKALLCFEEYHRENMKFWLDLQVQVAPRTVPAANPTHIRKILVRHRKEMKAKIGSFLDFYGNLGQTKDYADMGDGDYGFVNGISSLIWRIKNPKRYSDWTLIDLRHAEEELEDLMSPQPDQHECEDVPDYASEIHGRFGRSDY